MPGQYIIEVKSKKKKQKLRTVSKIVVENEPTTSSVTLSESGALQGFF